MFTFTEYDTFYFGVLYFVLESVTLKKLRNYYGKYDTFTVNLN